MTKRFKKSRRLGVNICGHPKAMKKFNKYNTRDSKNLSNYGKQLLEKQRLKAYYNIKEKKLKRYFKKSLKKNINTGSQLLLYLETRLDNIVYRSGIAKSIYQARQFVVHGHILVNDQKMSYPSYNVELNDKIKLKENMHKNKLIKKNLDNNNFDLKYLIVNKSNFSAKLINNPSKEEIPLNIQESLIIEYYSK
ncbi:MAG: 30S ribosomal protein S4 [Bacillota bacterium]